MFAGPSWRRCCLMTAAELGVPVLVVVESRNADGRTTRRSGVGLLELSLVVSKVAFCFLVGRHDVHDARPDSVDRTPQQFLTFLRKYTHTSAMRRFKVFRLMRVEPCG
jgi:hypothetical protein